MEIQIPIQVKGYLDELQAQNKALSERCAAIAGEKAGLEAENKMLKQELGRIQQEQEAAKSAAGSMAEGDEAKTA